MPYFQVYDPLDLLAAVTAHIPDKGEHLVCYYRWYSNIAIYAVTGSNNKVLFRKAEEGREFGDTKSGHFRQAHFP